MPTPAVPVSRDIGPVVVDQEVASLSTPILPDTAVAFLGGQPWAAAAVIAAWAGCGIAIAFALKRRGHDVRALGALGVALGPFLLGLARANLIPRELTAKPIELDPGQPARDGTRVLVALLGSPGDVADVIPLLNRLGAGLGEVILVRPIPFEAAEDPSWHDEKGDAARALFDAAVFLAEFRPRLLLVPGRGDRAITDFLGRQSVDVAIAVGASTDLASVCREVGGGRAAVVISGTDGFSSQPPRR